MNIFRLAGDVSHLVAIIILLLKIWRSKSCAGRLTLISVPFNSVVAGGLVTYGTVCVNMHAVVLFSKYSRVDVHRFRCQKDYVNLTSLCEVVLHECQRRGSVSKAICSLLLLIATHSFKPICIRFLFCCCQIMQMVKSTHSCRI